MKQDFCAKCKKYGFVEKHHILPRNVFGENDQIEWLCPNCHTAYHQFLGTENLKNPDMVFHLLTYLKWAAGLLPVVLFLIWILFL
ncbi:MAG: hypothetical protein EAZ97_13375 [Bacteroidetes bacterium]|nr:MAG: hypothetical protein EAZ97_13375 [Bacteroidota bacterium]